MRPPWGPAIIGVLALALGVFLVLYGISKDFG